jgi:hypothetical protein
MFFTQKRLPNQIMFFHCRLDLIASKNKHCELKVQRFKTFVLRILNN